MIKRVIFAGILIALSAAIYITANSFYFDKRLELSELDVASKAVDFTSHIPFQLPRLDGKVIQSKSFSNQVLIVHFWGSWCPPCIKEFPQLIKMADRFSGVVKVLAVAVDDSPAAIQRFLRKNNLSTKNIEILLDINGQVADIYGSSMLPESYIFGTNGQFVRKVAGEIDWLSPATVNELKKLSQ